MCSTYKETKTYSFEDILKEKGCLVYTNVGTSMMPLLRQQRDLIEIQAKTPGIRFKKYDVVLYKRGDRYILHRILKVCHDDYVIVGDHCIKREYGITDDQILGVLIRVLRDGRTITPDNKMYQLYTHLWCDFYHVTLAILYMKRVLWAVKHKARRLISGGRIAKEKKE